MVTETSPSTLWAKPVLGMIVAFKPTASAELAGIPARVIDIWPRFRSGDYLVMLEYDQPVKFGNEFIRQIAAFMSELEQPNLAQMACSVSGSKRSLLWHALH